MLKLRLAVQTASRVPVMQPGSWRTDQQSSASSRGYGYRWQKYRAWFLRKHPLCVYCQREGRTAAAEVVDHIVPHRGNRDLFWEPGNHQSLCAWHHNTTKAKEETEAGLR